MPTRGRQAPRGPGGERPAPVAVAVVSWNTRELLERCLESLADEVRGGRADVWVVDNGSSDGSAEAARRQAPWATVVEPASNLGFGRAVNLVARRTRGPWLMATNADIALDPGALETLLDAGEDPGVGCVAPRLTLPGGETQQSVHPLPTVPFTLAFNLGLHSLSPRLADRLCLPHPRNAHRPRDVPWAIGACLLLRRTAFEAVGGFDERQWMYGEDLDLGWRLRQAGWRTRYEPRAAVRHESGAATRQAFGNAQVQEFMAATYAMLLRRRGFARAWATAAINVAGAAARLAWMVPLKARLADGAERVDATWGWLVAHREGLRRLPTLRDGS